VTGDNGAAGTAGDNGDPGQNGSAGGDGESINPDPFTSGDAFNDIRYFGGDGGAGGKGGNALSADFAGGNGTRNGNRQWQ